MVEDAYGERDGLKDHCQKVEWELGETRQRTNDAQWRIGELDAEVNAKNSELTNRAERISWLECELQNTRKALDDTKWRCGELEAQAEKSKGIEVNLQQAERKIHDLMQENANFKGALQEMHHTKSLPTLKRQQSSQDEAYDELTVELRSVHHRKYELETQLMELTSEYRGLQQVHAGFEERIKALNMELEALREKYGKIEWANGELEAEKHRLQDAVNRTNDHICCLQEELNNAHSEINSLQNKDRTKHMKWLEDEKRRLDQECESLNRQLSETSDRARWHEGENGYFKNQLKDAYAKIEWLESETG
ncbi:unnamed protein product, partial [Soboliphyme baturini]|uniref:IF rod domain-containing protein n=1 Tax=Soboliphyme baturini TaxID=241478 RepID=A0A183J435_9BILA